MATQTGSIDLKAAKSANDEASKVATNYLAVDTSGIMVYDGTNGEQTPSNPDADTNNVFIDDNSLDIRKGSTVLATFGSDGAQIGQNVSGMSRAVISEDGMQIYQKDSNGNDVEIANLGYGLGNAEGGSTATTPYYTLGTRASGSIGNYSVAEGRNSVAEGYCSHAEGFNSTANADGAHSEGSSTTADGNVSHSEGEGTQSHGVASHAEGYGTHAMGNYSHTEGHSTTADGHKSHAEGDSTLAYGEASHAQGFHTKALSAYQTALGKYNKTDIDSKYVLIVGNGGSERLSSNALTVSWDGNVEMALDTTATSGVDKEIYDALVSLGWTDVIV